MNRVICRIKLFKLLYRKLSVKLFKGEGFFFLVILMDFFLDLRKWEKEIKKF